MNFNDSVKTLKRGLTERLGATILIGLAFFHVMLGSKWYLRAFNFYCQHLDQFIFHEAFVIRCLINEFIKLC